MLHRTDARLPEAHTLAGSMVVGLAGCTALREARRRPANRVAGQFRARVPSPPASCRFRTSKNSRPAARQPAIPAVTTDADPLAPVTSRRGASLRRILVLHLPASAARKRRQRKGEAGRDHRSSNSGHARSACTSSGSATRARVARSFYVGGDRRRQAAHSHRRRRHSAHAGRPPARLCRSTACSSNPRASIRSPRPAIWRDDRAVRPAAR